MTKKGLGRYNLIMANEQNLIPVKTKEEARERGRNGGIRSGEAKREKKLLSERYAKMLASEFNIDGETLDDIIKGVLKRKDSASVSMLKEMREASEGSKIDLSGEVNNPSMQVVFIESSKTN